MREPRYWVKDAIFAVLSAFASDPAAQFNVVLLYHSVGVEVPWAVTAESFRRQLNFLRDNFQVVTLAEMHRLTAAGNGPSRAQRLASITFDDGALDNYTQAFPALEALGLKGTFFIVTGRTGGTYQATYYQTPAMDRSHLKEVADRGHEIGSHTVSHPKLTQLPRASVMAEMTESKKHLEDLTGLEVASFSYPFGDTNQEVRDCAEEAGFRCAAGTHEALCPLPPADWFRVPRVGVNSTVSMLQFRGMTSLALERYERFRKRRGPRPKTGGRAEQLL